MKQNEGRKELKETLEYMNEIRGEIIKWQGDTESFFDKASGYAGKKIEEKIEEDKILCSDLSDKITSVTIELMNQFKENVDKFASLPLSKEGKAFGKGILLPYLEYYGKMDIYGAFKNSLPEKDYNQILTAYRELVSHLEKAIESIGGK